MPRATGFPKYCVHSTSGHAYCKLQGRQFWFGPSADPATRERFDRFVATWLANGRRLPQAPVAPEAGPTTVSMALLAYVQHVETVQSPRRAYQIKFVLSRLRKLYGSTSICGFKASDLEAVRATWIEGALTRETIRGYVAVVRAFFQVGSQPRALPHERVAGALDR